MASLFEEFELQTDWGPPQKRERTFPSKPRELKTYVGRVQAAGEWRQHKFTHWRLDKLGDLALYRDQELTALYASGQWVAMELCDDDSDGAEPADDAS